MTTEITEYSATESALAELRGKYEKAVFDVTTTKGLEEARKARAELRTIRTTLEKKRVEIKGPALTRCRLIDSEAKRITAEIEKLEDPIDQAIKAEEGRKEAERAARAKAAEEAARAIRAKLDAIRGRPLSVIGKPAPVIAALIDDTKALEFADLPEEHQAEAIRLRDEAIEKLIVMHSDRVSADAEAARLAQERAELERQRKEQEAAAAEQVRIAREQREAQEAADRELRQREAAKLQELREQQERELAGERKRLADEEAERQRAAQAERERLDAERREFEQRQAEAARVERERQEAAEREAAEKRRSEEAAERQRQIDTADLIGAAGEAVELLRLEGFAEHIVTMKLAAALDREAAKRNQLPEAA